MINYECIETLFLNLILLKDWDYVLYSDSFYTSQLIKEHVSLYFPLIIISSSLPNLSNHQGFKLR